MRIGYRKRIGKSGFYVGGSFSTKKLGKGIVSIIMIPFYFIYFTCIWPFIAIYKAVTKKSHRESAAEKANAKMLASQYMGIINDCSRLVSDTKTPGVFFSRYDLLLETLSKFAQIEGVSPISSGSPSAELVRLSNMREEATDDFIRRYAREARKKAYELTTERGKRNKAEAFKKILMEYEEKMTQKNMETVESEYKKILESI